MGLCTQAPIADVHKQMKGSIWSPAARPEPGPAGRICPCTPSGCHSHCILQCLPCALDRCTPAEHEEQKLPISRQNVCCSQCCKRPPTHPEWGAQHCLVQHQSSEPAFTAAAGSYLALRVRILEVESTCTEANQRLPQRSRRPSQLLLAGGSRGCRRPLASPPSPAGNTRCQGLERCCSAPRVMPLCGYPLQAHAMCSLAEDASAVTIMRSRNPADRQAQRPAQSRGKRPRDPHMLQLCIERQAPAARRPAANAGQSGQPAASCPSPWLPPPAAQWLRRRRRHRHWYKAQRSVYAAAGDDVPTRDARVGGV